jgi:hypothetical protein
VVRVDVEKDNRGDDRNVIKTVVEPDHKDYGQWVASLHKASGGGQSGAPTQVAPRIAAPTAQTYAPTTAPVSAPAAVTGKPSWAQ